MTPLAPAADPPGATRTLCFPRDHPCFAGHFPANPVLPGVLLLDALAEALGAAPAPGAVLVLEAVKFTAPVRPDAAVVLRWHPVGDGRVSFAAATDAVRVLSGRARWQPAPAAPGA